MPEGTYYITTEHLGIGPTQAISVNCALTIFFFCFTLNMFPMLWIAVFIYTATLNHITFELEYTCVALQHHIQMSNHIWVSNVSIKLDTLSRHRDISLTSVAVIEVCKLVPLIVFNQTKKCSFQVRSHLNDKWMCAICWKAGSNEGDMECSTKRCDGIYRLLVIKSKNSIDSSWKLGAN